MVGASVILVAEAASRAPGTFKGSGDDAGNCAHAGPRLVQMNRRTKAKCAPTFGFSVSRCLCVS
jgi:hypothetical protein